MNGIQSKMGVSGFVFASTIRMGNRLAIISSDNQCTLTNRGYSHSLRNTLSLLASKSINSTLSSARQQSMARRERRRLLGCKSTDTADHCEQSRCHRRSVLCRMPDAKWEQTGRAGDSARLGNYKQGGWYDHSTLTNLSPGSKSVEAGVNTGSSIGS